MKFSNYTKKRSKKQVLKLLIKVFLHYNNAIYISFPKHLGTRKHQIYHIRKKYKISCSSSIIMLHKCLVRKKNKNTLINQLVLNSCELMKSDDEQMKSHVYRALIY